MPGLKFLSGQALFIAQMLLALLGAYLTNYFEALSHYYWLLMVLLSAWVAIAPEYQQLQNNIEAKPKLIKHLLYWAGSLFATLIVYALHADGRIDIHESGLIILLILALSVYFDGIVTAVWRSAFTGFYLGLIVLSTAFPDTYLWPLCLLAIGSLALSYYLAQSGPQIDNVRL